MAIDTPATIAIIGAGPIGLEAALYARYLGYEVLLFERDTAAATVRRWGHVPMVTPFGTCVSKLGLAALHAQHPAWRPPSLAAAVTGDTWCKEYLLPLAHSDLLADSLKEHVEVVAIRRVNRPSDDAADTTPADDVREDADEEADFHEPAFQLSVRNTKTGAAPCEVAADVVIDASGGLGEWGHLSAGDQPLPGELAAAPLIRAGLPDVRSAARAKYAGRTTLLLGAGMSALANLTALTELTSAEPGTTVVWITPPLAANGDPTRDGARLAAGVALQAPHVQHWPGARIVSLDLAGADQVRVRFENAPRTEMVFDQIINDLPSLNHEPISWGLGIQPRLAPDVPRSSRQGTPPDFAGRHVGSIYAQIAQQLKTSEPNFYVLGSKRFAGLSDAFTIQQGLDEVCALFTILGDRPGLNLYATMDKLLP